MEIVAKDLPKECFALEYLSGFGLEPDQRLAVDDAAHRTSQSLCAQHRSIIKRALFARHVP